MRPDVIPQLADGPEVLAAIERRDGLAYSVLIPNERGLENALAVRDRFDEISVFLSASETHNRKNVNRSIAESLDGLERVVAGRARGRPALRGRDRDLVRLPLRGRGAGRSASSRSPSGCATSAARRSASATRPGWRIRARSASSTPRRSSVSARRRAHRALPQHPRPGARQRARGARAGHRLLRVELRRARRLPGSARLDRQRLDRGRGLDAARDGDRDRRRPAEADRGLARRPGAARPPARRARAHAPARSTGTARPR